MGTALFITYASDPSSDGGGIGATTSTSLLTIFGCCPISKINSGNKSSKTILNEFCNISSSLFDNSNHFGLFSNKVSSYNFPKNLIRDNLILFSYSVKVLNPNCFTKLGFS